MLEIRKHSGGWFTLYLILGGDISFWVKLVRSQNLRQSNFGLTNQRLHSVYSESLKLLVRSSGFATIYDQLGAHAWAGRVWWIPHFQMSCRVSRQLITWDIFGRGYGNIYLVMASQVNSTNSQIPDQVSRDVSLRTIQFNLRIYLLYC
jgi:hypothetical protein